MLFELLVVGEGNPEVPMFINPKKSLDDEHTPGIFDVVEVRTPPYKSHMFWLPTRISEFSNGMG